MCTSTKGCLSHKMSDHARRGQVRGASKTHVTTPNESQASEYEMRNIQRTTTFAQVLHYSKFYGRVVKKKATVEENSNELS